MQVSITFSTGYEKVFPDVLVVLGCQRVGRAYLRCSICSSAMTVMAMSVMGIIDKVFGGSEVSVLASALWRTHLEKAGDLKSRHINF